MSIRSRIPLRVALITDHFFPTTTGQGIHTSQIALAMARRDYHVVVITTRRPGQLNIEEWNGIRIYRTRSFPVNNFYAAYPSWKTVESILRRENINIVHHQAIGILALQSSRAARSLGIKQIYSHHLGVEFLTQEIWFFRPFRHWIMNLARRFYNQCDYITFPARSLHENAEKSGIHVPTMYISSVTGIEASQITSTRKRAHRPFVVLFVGRFDRPKNLSYLIEAFAQFRSMADHGELWIVGDGPMRNRLVQQVSERGLEPFVKFPGWVDYKKIGQYFAQARVFVFPSLIETQGNVAIEAMYYSLPLLVSRQIIAAKDLVEDGKSGFLIDPHSTRDLAEKLLELYKDPARAASMARQSRNRFEEFRAESIFKELEQLYFKVLGGNISHGKSRSKEN